MVKKNLLKAMAIAAVLCTGFGTYGITASASEVKKSATEVAWTMEQGAYVRMAEEDAGIGIRFTAQMSAADYTAIQAYGYTDLSYGVLIAPADYVGVKELQLAPLLLEYSSLEPLAVKLMVNSNLTQGSASFLVIQRAKS